MFHVKQRKKPVEINNGLEFWVKHQIKYTQRPAMHIIVDTISFFAGFSLKKNILGMYDNNKVSELRNSDSAEIPIYFSV